MTKKYRGQYYQQFPIKTTCKKKKQKTTKKEKKKKKRKSTKYCTMHYTAKHMQCTLPILHIELTVRIWEMQ